MTSIRSGGLAAVSILVATLVAACGAASPSPETRKEASAMRLTSPAFAEGAPIPAEHSRGGADRSPPLTWSDAPDGTQSFVLVCVDRAPVARGWVHWLVIGIPPDTVSLATGASDGSLPAGSRELANSFGEPGWGGPQPPAGTGAHTYEFTLYALDTAGLEAVDGGRLAGVLDAMDGHVLATGVLNGTFEP